MFESEHNELKGISKKIDTISKLTPANIDISSIHREELINDVFYDMFEMVDELLTKTKNLYIIIKYKDEIIDKYRAIDNAEYYGKARLIKNKKV